MNRLSRNVRLFCAVITISLFQICLNITPAMAQKASDEWKKTPISLRLSNIPLGQVIERVAKEAKAKIVYQDVALEGIEKATTLNVKDTPLDEVLKRLIGKQDVTIIFGEGREIIIKPTKEVFATDSKRYFIGGTVIDKETGEPVIGASVIITSNNEGVTLGVTTDIEGKFNLMVNHKSDIKISSLGYESVSMRINMPKSDIKVVLEPSSFSVGEVVVTGLSKRKKESFTGNVVSVKGEDLRKLSPNDLLKGLQFFDPSFRIVENNRKGSDPNAQPDFIMRGDQSLGIKKDFNSMDLLLDNVSSKPNQPLFVLDGFIVSIRRILELDPERVENITILKDAAASAIYGSRASNGVVVVETKIAPDGVLNISYIGGLTVEAPDLTDYNMMTASEKLDTEWRAGVYDIGMTTHMNRYNALRRNILAGVNTYWLSQPLRTAFKNRHSLTAAGGTEVFRYSLGLNVNSNPGVMKQSSNDTKSINFNMSYRKEKLNIGANINLSEGTGDRSPYGSFSDYVRINPYYRHKDDNGQEIKELDNFIGASTMIIANPLFNATVGSKNFTKNLTIATSLNLEYRLLQNLRITESLSYTRGIARAETFTPANHTRFANETDKTQKGSYSKNIGELTSWSSNLGINYNWAKEKHLVSMFANWTVSEDKNNYVNLSAKGYPSVHMDDFIFGSKMDTNPSGTENIARAMGFTGQVSYSYDNKYSFDFNLRGEVSSRYAQKEMTPFWSTGFRWNAHQERWLQGRVSNLVLRATYGITGDQNFSPSEAVEYYTFSGMMRPYTSFPSLGARLSALHNPTLEWGKTDNLGVGLDLGFWNNRVNMSLNYYNNITRRMLTPYDLAPSTGFDSQTINSGEIQNQGVDFSANVIAYQDLKKGINWTVSFNANHNSNKIRKLSAFLKKLNERQLNSPGAPEPVLQEGESTSTFFAVRSLGIDPATGNEVFLTKDGKRTLEWLPNHKVSVGNTTPTISGSIMSGFNWKEFSFTMGLSYRLGGIVYNQTLVDKIENANIAYNLDKRAAEDRWTKPGDVTKYKILKEEQASTKASTRFIMNNNELNLSSIGFGYRMNRNKFKFLENLNIDVLSLNFVTSSLFRISSIKMERGLDYPFARSYSLNMAIIFK